MVWMEPGGNQGGGGMLPIEVARLAAKGYKADEPRRTVWIEYHDGTREEIRYEPPVESSRRSTV